MGGTDSPAGRFSYPFSSLPFTCSLNLQNTSLAASSLPAPHHLPGIIVSKMVYQLRSARVPPRGSGYPTDSSVVVNFFLAHAESYYRVGGEFNIRNAKECQSLALFTVRAGMAGAISVKLMRRGKRGRAGAASRPSLECLRCPGNFSHNCKWQCFAFQHSSLRPVLANPLASPLYFLREYVE